MTITISIIIYYCHHQLQYYSIDRCLVDSVRVGALSSSVRGRGRRARHAGLPPRLPRALHRALARGGTPLVLPDVPAAGHRRRERLSSLWPVAS
jgi:hypothetical protein